MRNSVQDIFKLTKQPFGDKAHGLIRKKYKETLNTELCSFEENYEKYSIEQT